MKSLAMSALAIVLALAVLAAGWQTFQLSQTKDALNEAEDVAAAAMATAMSRAKELDQMREASQRLGAELARERADRIRYQSIIDEIEEMRDETPVPPAVAAALARLRGDEGDYPRGSEADPGPR